MAAATIIAIAGASRADAAYLGANGRIFFSAAADVWSIEPDGTGLTNLTDLPGGPGSGADPSVSPGGVVAFVVGTGAAAEIWTMAADGSGAHAVTANAGRDTMPAISRDGATIAFVTDRGGAGADVWTMAADGSNPSPLLTAPGDDEHPQYSPDGQYVVAATHDGADLDLAYVPASGGPYAAATTITLNALDETAPALQPDQIRLAYVRAGDIQTAYYNGTDEFPLAIDPGVTESSPAFSPDGTQVVYATGSGLVLAAAGGLGPHPLSTPGAAGPTDPDWAVGTPPDRTPPQTTITKRPPRRTIRPKVRVRFASNEAGSTFRCRLDRDRPIGCYSPQTYRELTAGRHRFRVVATDAAGNIDPSAATARFSVLERDR